MTYKSTALKFRNRNDTGQRGVSLLETLLSVSLIALLIISTVRIFDQIAETETARASAQLTNKVTGAMLSYLESPTNFATLHSGLPASGRMEIPTAAAPGFDLEDTGELPTGFRNRLPAGDQLRIFVRDASAGSDLALEVLVLSAERVPDDLARQAAEYIGPEGVIISAADTTGGSNCAPIPGGCGRALRSAFGVWETRNAADFGIFATLPSATTADGAYFGQFLYLQQDILFGDALFRVANVDEELNTMFTELNMGTFNMVGVDNMEVNNTLSVRRDVIANGSVRVTGTMFVAGDTDIHGRTTMNNLNMRNSSGAPTATDGSILVQESAETDTLQTTTLEAERGEFSGSLQSSRIFSDTMDVNRVDARGSRAGTFVEDFTIDTIDGDPAARPPRALVTNELSGNGIIETNNNNTGVDEGQFRVENDVTVGGGLDVTNSILRTGGATRIDELESCEVGCQ